MWLLRTEQAVLLRLALLAEKSPSCHLERTQGFHALIESTNCTKKKLKKKQNPFSHWCVISPASTGKVLQMNQNQWDTAAHTISTSLCVALATLQHTPSVPAHVWPLLHCSTHHQYQLVPSPCLCFKNLPLYPQ